MERGRIKKYIEDWYKKEIPPLIERELIVSPIERKVISIIGPRRVGKTFYFFQLMKPIKDYSVYFDFEDSSLANLRFDEVLDVINLFIEITGKEPTHIFLDEVQSIEKWESMIRTLLDRTNYKIFITGSSSKLLPKEIATQLRGRSITYLLLGFSFREFLKAKKVKIEKILSQVEKAKIKKLLKEYLDFGSFPEVVLREEKERILKEYYDAIFFKDFVERHKLKSFNVANLVFSHFFQNFSAEISINRIVDFFRSQGLKMGKNTIYDYTEKLQDTLAIFFIRKFSQKVSIRESWPKKVYICDTGISRILRFSEDIGKLMENAVFLELLRTININPLLEIFYWKDYQQNEVDFVIKEGLNIKQLIQVSYASSKEEIEKREIKSLIKASKQLNCRDLLIVTWDYDDELKINNRKIICKPLWSWLIS